MSLSEQRSPTHAPPRKDTEDPTTKRAQRAQCPKITLFPTGPELEPLNPETAPEDRPKEGSTERSLGRCWAFSRPGSAATLLTQLNLSPSNSDAPTWPYERGGENILGVAGHHSQTSLPLNRPAWGVVTLSEKKPSPNCPWPQQKPARARPRPTSFRDPRLPQSPLNGHKDPSVRAS